MTPRQREYDAIRTARAIRQRVALVVAITEPGHAGGVLCAICRTEHDPADMEIDHVDGIGWDHASMNMRMRVARYWREHRAGIRLRGLCRSCNARDGSRRMWKRRQVA